MKFVLVAILALLMVPSASFAKDKSTDKPASKSARKPAESHGGVAISNAQFEAVSRDALAPESSDMSGLYRLLGIVKRIDCHNDNGAIFELQWGGQNSSGKESVSERVLVLADSGDGMGNVNSIKITGYTGKSCRTR